jgi:hypothetical protein
MLHFTEWFLDIKTHKKVNMNMYPEGLPYKVRATLTSALMGHTLILPNFNWLCLRWERAVDNLFDLTFLLDVLKVASMFTQRTQFSTT